MRWNRLLALVPAFLSVASVARAEADPDAGSPVAVDSEEPADAPPPQKRYDAPRANLAQTPPPPVPAPQPPPPRLLAPVFSEDRFPGDDPSSATDVELTRGGGKLPALRLSMHGYFRAPMRFSRVPREQGTIRTDNGFSEGKYDYRTPLLIDDDYYQSGFLYLPVNERAWHETYLSVGNERLTATVGLHGSQFADTEDWNNERQFGVAQGWLTYRYSPLKDLNLRVKGGAFWDRFGYLPKYDTYIFGRTHQTGVQARAEYQAGDLTFWLLDGVGTHSEAIKSSKGLTMVHYANAGASWRRNLELGLFYLNASTADKRPYQQDLTDASLRVLGADVRVNTPAGRLHLAYSTIRADKVKFLSSALEVMHSYGRLVMDNYLGPQSNDGTGTLSNLAFQYDLSVADLARGFGLSQSNPLPWGGDVTASVFGLMTKVTSDQKTDTTDANTTRESKKDGVTKWKWGTEVGWRATEWVGAYLRYDRVLPDVDDSATGYRVISPRVALFTHFFTNEAIFVQYSTYSYKDAVTLRQGQEAGITKPDEKVFKVQAQISY